MNPVVNMLKLISVLKVLLILITFTTLAVLSSCGAAIHSQDVKSLVALRNFVSKRRSNHMNWFGPDSPPPCSWDGIGCNQGGAVLRIDLSCTALPLDLPFPTIIAHFSKLKYLNLSRCELTGTVPLGIWNLKELESLDLSDNRLSGMLPPTLANLKLLRELVLDYNNFSGMLPSAIGSLIKLEELSVHANLFSGSIPKEVGNLQHLQSLDLSMNFFSGTLPSSLGNLTSLLYFDGSNNRFEGPLFPEIRNLVSLRNLQLSWNSFTGSIPMQLGALSSLTYLNLAQNNFDGELPDTIGKLTNLSFLLAANAGLSGRIPSQLGCISKLRVLDLSFNSFVGSLPHSLAGLNSIKSFIVDSNRLSGSIPMWISNWTRVESIMISKNFLSGSLPPLSMPTLNLLDASSNMLSGELREDICSAKSLTHLLLSDNHFRGTINNTFRKCFRLTDLILSGNHFFGNVPGYLGKISLVTLELSTNRFFGEIPDQLWESKTLMEVSLSNNLLASEIPASLGKVSTLQRLQLDNNMLEGGIPRSIGKLANLTNLSLHGNRFSGDIPLELFNCTKLVSLDLGENSLTGAVPRSISKLKVLDNLVLSRNKLSGVIPEEICSGFQQVPFPDSEFTQHYGMLDLSYNELVGPIPASIKDCIVVEELLLKGNNLSGSIPDEISGLPNLTFLDLSYNHFTQLPHLFSLKNLQGLNLSHNQLTGSIPTDLPLVMPSLAKLDLSSNQFTGPLPPSVFAMQSLSYLDISQNHMSGHISFCVEIAASSLLVLNASNNHFSGTLSKTISNLTTLSSLDLHNNSLTGTLPPSLSDLAALTYLDLSNNDFQQSIPCNICSLVGLTFVDFSGNSFTGDVAKTCMRVTDCLQQDKPAPSPLQVQYRFEHGVHRASVIAVALGAASSLFVLFIFFIARRKMTLGRNAASIDKEKLVRAAEPTDDELFSSKSKEPISINIATFEQSLRRLSAADIVTATDNFSKTYIVGDGGFGTVYKASLPEGRTIAVKRLNGGLMHGDREFLAELETLGKVKHDNLVHLLGYCVFADERFLIYEYMENGSLDVWLRNKADAVEALDWPTRFNICLGAAKGLAFLHHGFVPHIIHRDIKSSNILLDSNFNPRVSDFGLARIISACESHVSTVLAGTFGYIPPEYGQTMVATVRGDVYSFGVVLLELITGREPTGQSEIEGGNLVGSVRRMVAMGRDSELLDPCFCGSVLWKDQMLRVLDIARSCTCDEPWKRPSMLQVVKLLTEAKV